MASFKNCTGGRKKAISYWDHDSEHSISKNAKYISEIDRLQLISLDPKKVTISELLNQFEIENCGIFVAHNLNEFLAMFASVTELGIFISKLAGFRKVVLLTLNDGVKRSLRDVRQVITIIDAFEVARAKRKSDEVRRGLQNAKNYGQQLGRPQTIDANAIYGLRQKGLTIKKISDELGLSVGSVHRILKQRLDINT